MKKLLFIIAAILSCALLFSCADTDLAERNVYSEEEVTSPIVANEDTFGVEINPPTSFTDNSDKLADAADITIVTKSGTEYVMIYGSSAAIANDLNELLWSSYRKDVEMFKQTDKSAQLEILAGETDRALSARLAAAVIEATGGGANYAWGYAVEDGKLAIYASGNYGRGAVLEEIKNSFFGEDSFTVKEGLFVVKYKNIAEHEAELAAVEQAKEEAKKKERLQNVLDALDEFKRSTVFGESPSVMPSDAYPDPEQYPTYGEHPRVYVNAETLPELREVFFNPPEDLEILVQRTKEYADYDFNGVFPEIEGKNYTYDGKYFKYMEAKAFMYLMTGEEVYGYEAILCAKNCILTMVYTDQIFKDTYRGASHSIAVITEIYDWCYDLMTEEDKAQIINGSKKYLFDTLEFNYPPSNMGYVSGHGMGGQFLRDYLGFSLAIYDERPDWWDFVGGRFYSQYCLGINYCLEGGYYSQGTSCYAPGKLNNIYTSAWLVERATGVFPYVDGLEDIPYFMLSQLQPNGKYFQYGDGATTATGASVNAGWMIMAVGTYNNPAVYAAAKKFSNGFTSLSENEYGTKMTPMTALIHLAGCAGSTEQFAENLPLIEYTGSPAGITVARDSWSDDAAAVYMKVGELYMSNHDHRDSGTFQIYYKGLLAGGNAGQYNVYGTEHWKYYHQATVSNNGLLVFDPDLYEEAQLTPLLDENGEPKIDKYGNPMYKVLNPAKAFYTGSQRAVGESSSFDLLISGLYDFGKVTGHAEGYKQNGDAKYAYLAGDITSAYEENTASYVSRSMLSVFTDDPDYPMYVFVYDNVAPTPGDDDVIMRFLLHSVTEPTVSGNRVTVENGDGQLNLINVTSDSIETLGGSGNKYNINGVNLYEDTYEIGLSTGSKQDNDDNGVYWGRTEVSAPVGKDGNRMLNAMYVADKGQTLFLEASLIDHGSVIGTLIEKTAVFFADNSDGYMTEQISVSTSSENTLLNYYFCGLDTGTWKVYLGEGEDRQYLGTTYSTSVTHMVTFNAPAGVITLEPGADIRPADSGKILYQNVSEKITEPEYYSYGGTTKLPATAKNGNAIFLGWYLDSEFTKPITEIDGTLYRGSLAVFAKFKFAYANEDFDWAKDSPIDKNNFSKDGISYSNAEDKTVNYKSGYKNGKGYVSWYGTTGGPVIGISNTQNSISTLKSNSVTYTFSLAKDADMKLLSTVARLYGTSGIGGSPLNLFTTSTGGKLTVCGYTHTLTEDFFTFSIEIDFENGRLIAYGESGNILGEQNFSAPPQENVSSTLEWKEKIKSTVLNWRNNGGGGELASIRIGLIRIEEGGFITSPDACAHRDINDDGKCERCASDFTDGCEHYDSDDDKKCDKCNEDFDDGCDHRDASDDGRCDKCSESFDDGCELCRDTNDDGKCDRCEKSFSDGCDNHRDADDNGVCDVTGCGKSFSDGCDHIDKNDDEKCDKCQELFTDGCDIHRDADDNGKCDNGGEDYDDGEELPEGQWIIVYETFGATLSGGAPTVHCTGTATPLPTELEKSGYSFGGWYTDEEFTERVDEIDASVDAPVKLYAKWNFVFFSDDYSWAENESVNSSTLASHNKLSYGKSEDALVNYETAYVNGDGYIIWTGSTGGPVITASKTDPSIATVGSEKIRLTVSIAKCEDETLLNTGCRIFDDNGGELVFFNTNGGKLNVAGVSIELTEEFFTFSVVMDFSDGYMRAYDADGNLIGEKLYAIPAASGAESYAQWQTLFASKSNINYRNNGVKQDNTNDTVETGKIKISLFVLEEC